MGEKKYRPLRFNRNKLIVDSREEAILKLNTGTHKIGQPVIIRYYSNPEKTIIDNVFAIGTHEGTGENSYKVLSIGGLQLVTDVVKELPDITELVHDQLYIYIDELDGGNYFVYKEDNSRKFEELGENQITIISLKTGKSYYASKEIVKEVSDFYTQEQIDELFNLLDQELDLYKLSINEKFVEVENKINSDRTDLEKIIQDLENNLSEKIKELQLNIFPLNITKFETPIKLFEEGTINDINFSFSVQRKNLDITNDCTFKINEIQVTPDNNTFPEIKVDTKFTLEAFYQDSYPVKSSLDIKFAKRSFWSVVDKDFVISEDNIKEKSQGVVRLKSTLSFISSLDNQKIFFTYPKNYGLLSGIYDSNGFDYLSDYILSEVSISGVPYYIYCKGTATTIIDFKQIFTY